MTDAVEELGGQLSAAEQVLAPRPLAHLNHADYYRHLLANCRRICNRDMAQQANWVLAMNLFATGSSSARQICVDAGIDPDALTVARR